MNEFGSMNLRDHPLMCFMGRLNWPPLWTSNSVPRRNWPRGEVGILKQALTHDYFPHKSFLVMEYEGQTYMGCISFDDVTFCRQITTVLNGCSGYTMKQVGDLDLVYTG